MSIVSLTMTQSLQNEFIGKDALEKHITSWKNRKCYLTENYKNLLSQGVSHEQALQRLQDVLIHITSYKEHVDSERYGELITESLNSKTGTYFEKNITSKEVNFMHYHSNNGTVEVSLIMRNARAEALSFRVKQNGKVYSPEVKSFSDNGNAGFVKTITLPAGNNSLFDVQIESFLTVEKEVPYTVVVSGGTFTEAFAQRETFLRQIQAEDAAKSRRVDEYIKKHGVKRLEQMADGTTRGLVDVIDGEPQYYHTFNITAAKTTSTDKVWPGGSLGLNLTGESLKYPLGVWDAGAVLTTHQEFDTRVTLGDNVATHDHSTHVAGTMIASGVQARAKGMSYKAKVISYDWNQNNSEMSSEGTKGMLVSQHSYGQPGNYKYSRTWDQMAMNMPYHLISKSAANDGPGHSTVTLNGNAKNILTVGSVEDQPNGWQGPNVKLSNFSSRGPAPDGRIKPDIMGNGAGVYSPSNSGNTNYVSKSGTSMAGPNVAGNLGVLQEHYYNTHNNTYMLAATLKGLVIHTADQIDAPGPDYSSGWGLMNTAKAADLITKNKGGDELLIQELTLNSGETKTFEYDLISGEDAIATISWHDPAPSSNTGRALVNDLDIRITIDGTEHLPWKLDPNNKPGKATKGDNNLDNVEQVFVKGATGSKAVVKVSHKGTLSSAQKYTLVVSGMMANKDPFVQVMTPNGGEKIEQNSKTTITWSDNIDEKVKIELYKGSSKVETIVKETDSDGSYEWQVAEDMKIGDDYSIKISSIGGNTLVDESDKEFSIVEEYLIDEFPFVENFDKLDTGNVTLSEKWVQLRDDDIDWLVLSGPTPSKVSAQGGDTGPDGDNTSGNGNYVYVEASGDNNPNKKATIVTPKFKIDVLEKPVLFFYYHMFSGTNTMGELALDIEVDGKWNKDVVKLSGDNGDKWNYKRVDLDKYSGKRVRFQFRGVTGTSYASDICIDDFTITSLPKFTSTPAKKTMAEKKYTYKVRVNDDGQDDVKIYSGDLPKWLTFDDEGKGKGLLEGTPEEKDTGIVEISLFATDGMVDDSTIQEFKLSVEPITALDENAIPVQGMAITMGPNPASPKNPIYFNLTQPRGYEVSVSVYDNVGNFIYSKALKTGMNSWDLSKSANKKIGQGSYLAAFTIKDISTGKQYLHKKVISVK